MRRGSCLDCHASRMAYYVPRAMCDVACVMSHASHSRYHVSCIRHDVTETRSIYHKSFVTYRVWVCECVPANVYLQCTSVHAYACVHLPVLYLPVHPDIPPRKYSMNLNTPSTPTYPCTPYQPSLTLSTLAYLCIPPYPPYPPTCLPLHTSSHPIAPLTPRPFAVTRIH